MFASFPCQWVYGRPVHFSFSLDNGAVQPVSAFRYRCTAVKVERWKRQQKQSNLNELRREHDPIQCKRQKLRELKKCFAFIFIGCWSQWNLSS